MVDVRKRNRVYLRVYVVSVGTQTNLVYFYSEDMTAKNVLSC